jgi:hypothetical protein
MQKIAIAGIAVALVALTGLAENAEAGCMRHGMTNMRHGISTTCRQMARLHHYRHLASYRRAYPGYGYGYGYGYGSSHSPYDNTSSAAATEQHNQGTGN